MQKWEYCQVIKKIRPIRIYYILPGEREKEFSKGGNESLNDLINQLGENGWELVIASDISLHYSRPTTETVYIFKRPKES